MNNYHPYYDYNYPLVSLDKESSQLNLGDCFRGVACFGATGSGKSSTIGKKMAKAFLKSGYGGIVLCAKKDEVESWIDWAKEANREDSLIIFSDYNSWRFNFLDYEMNRGGGGGDTQNIVRLLMYMYEMVQQQGGGQQREERFWDGALKRLLANIIDLIKLSGEVLTIDNLYAVISSSPIGGDYIERVNGLNDEEYSSLVNSSYCIRCIHHAAEKEKTQEQQHVFELVYNYWMKEFPSIPEKTRFTIEESFLSIISPFTRGLLHKLFVSADSNIKPEITHEGYVIILDIPVKEHLQQGILAQSLFKYMWQQATERRDVKALPKPVFLYADEVQYFTHKEDAIFQSTARSSKVCTVYLTQNLPTYYAHMGDSGKYYTDVLLGNMATKVFLANQDRDTNEYASEMIGNEVQHLMNFSQRGNIGGSEQMLPQVLPKEFTVLKTGGVSNDFEVEVIVTTAGKVWEDGKNYLRTTFNQKNI